MGREDRLDPLKCMSPLGSKAAETVSTVSHFIFMKLPKTFCVVNEATDDKESIPLVSWNGMNKRTKRIGTVLMPLNLPSFLLYVIYKSFVFNLFLPYVLSASIRSAVNFTGLPDSLKAMAYSIGESFPGIFTLPETEETRVS